MSLQVYTLVVFATLVCVTDHYEVIFRTVSRGFQFNPFMLGDPLAVRSSVRSLTNCSMICAAKIDCQTVDFDSSLSRCHLFAEWIHEGSPSPFSMAQIAYISPSSLFYALYNRTCTVTAEDHRFLRCVNGRWTCQSNYYWNGTACSRGRTFNETCRTNNWCDRNRYLICLNISSRCACNHSMTWTGSQCTPSKQLLPSLTFTSIFVSLPSRTNRHHIRRRCQRKLFFHGNHSQWIR